MADTVSRTPHVMAQYGNDQNEKQGNIEIVSLNEILVGPYKSKGHTT